MIKNQLKFGEKKMQNLVSEFFIKQNIIFYNGRMY